MPETAIPLAFALLAVVAPAQEPQQVQLALKGLDPVELCSGKEVKGDPQRTAEHYVYRYRFASDDNREKFRAAPERYGVQLGGGCGRMGPQSGKGDPARYLVHDGRIYIFASDACRSTFQRDPERFLDPDQEPADGDAERGAALIAKARAAHGGDRITEMDSLTSRTARVQEVNGQEMEVGQRWTIGFPNRMRLDKWWGEYDSRTVVVRNAGFKIADDGTEEDMHQSAVRELTRAVVRHPIPILRASALDGFRAVHLGAGRVGDTPVERVAVSFLGTTTTLAIDPETGHVLSVAYRGRGPQLWFGQLEAVLSDYREVGGVLLPHHEEVRFDGEDVMTRDWVHEVDRELGEDFFRR